MEGHVVTVPLFPRDVWTTLILPHVDDATFALHLPRVCRFFRFFVLETIRQRRIAKADDIPINVLRALAWCFRNIPSSHYPSVFVGFLPKTFEEDEGKELQVLRTLVNFDWHAQMWKAHDGTILHFSRGSQRMRRQENNGRPLRVPVLKEQEEEQKQQQQQRDDDDDVDVDVKKKDVVLPRLLPPPRIVGRIGSRCDNGGYCIDLGRIIDNHIITVTIVSKEEQKETPEQNVVCCAVKNFSGLTGGDEKLSDLLQQLQFDMDVAIAMFTRYY